MQVNLARDLRRGMPQQRLRGAERRSCRVQQRRVCVTKPMPVHSGKPERLTGRRQLTVQQVSSAPHRSASRAEDQPIGIHRIREAVRDNLDGLGSKRNGSVAPHGLGLVEMAFKNRLPDSNISRFQIDITPPQRERLLETSVRNIRGLELRFPGALAPTT